MILQSLLQIKIAPAKKEISFHNPSLPSYLQVIKISGLIVDGFFAELEIENHNNLVNVLWKNQPEEWKLVIIR
jgi:hypothetical protein